MDPLQATSGSTPRQLIVLFDGTNNNITGGRKDTNVVALAELLTQRPDPRRLVYYDPGVGNPGELPGTTVWDSLRNTAERIAGLAFGRGVFENMAEAYQFLMRHWQPGDEIYVFGFSRGAFTARSLAGMINRFGLLMPQMTTMVATLVHVYFAKQDSPKWQAIAEQATRLFAGAKPRTPDIHFVGVWDTVASVGMAPFGLRFTALPRLADKRFIHVRQALALDELRAQFKPRLYAEDNGPLRTRSGREGSVMQLWFRGAHCDVGGGYAPQQATLSDQALAWLVSEAAHCGLRIGTAQQPVPDEGAVAAAFDAILQRPAQRPPRVHSQLHESCLWALTGMNQRETQAVLLDEKAPEAVRTAEHPSVESVTASVDSVWQGPRNRLAALLAGLLVPLWALVLGQLLAGFTSTGGGLWADLLAAFGHWHDYLAANVRLAHWQLGGLIPWTWSADTHGFHAPRWAVVWDLAMIASYAFVLAWAVSWAFARLSGLRRLGMPVSRLQNGLGWALPLAVFADLAEDLLTWLTLTLLAVDLQLLAHVAAFFMGLCAVLKFVGLAGALGLVAWGAVHRAAPSLRQPGTAAAATP